MVERPQERGRLDDVIWETQPAGKSAHDRVSLPRPVPKTRSSYTRSNALTILFELVMLVESTPLARMPASAAAADRSSINRRIAVANAA